MVLLVAEGAKRPLGSPTTKRARTIRRHWLFAASAGAIAAATPGYMGFYGGRARAQLLPATCTDANTAGTPNDGDGVAEDGETITCVTASGTIRGLDTTDVDDLTIVIGTAATATQVGNPNGDGIDMSGTGAQTLTILNANSYVKGTNGVDVTVTAGSAGDLTIVSDGEIQGFGATGYGVNARNYGSGDTAITLHNVVGGNRAVFAQTGDAGASLNVRTYDSVTGDAGPTGVGVFAVVGTKNGNATGALTIDTSDEAGDGSHVFGGHSGVFAINYGSGDTSIKVDDATGGNGVLAVGYAGDTEVTLTSTAFIEGESGAGVYMKSTTGDVSLTGSSGPSGVVSARFSDGVFQRSGSGTITVQSLQSIDGERGDGVDADAGVGDIVISDITTISGYGSRTTGVDQGHGIRAITNGGAISIQNVGVGTGDLDRVLGADGNGIHAVAGAGSVDIGGVTAVGNITGASNGVYAKVDAGGGAMTIDTSGGRVDSADNNGIRANHEGAGALSITVNDVVGGSEAGSGEAGIFASSTQSTANVTLQGAQGAAYINTVLGNTYGIDVSTAANSTIQNLNSVTGTSKVGIRVFSSAGGTTRISEVGKVIGGTRGIEAVNAGGDISIQGSGLAGGIEGKSGEGIFAFASANGVGGASGGDINIGGVTANGDIKGSGLGGDGVAALTDGEGTITIAVGAVTTTGNDAAGVRAVTGNASTAGGGDISITTSGAVSTTGTDSYGILAETARDGDITVNVDDVTATNSVAIRTRAGAGETVITLTSTADVESGVGAGVDAASTAADGHITLQGSSGNVTGAADGAYLRTVGAYITVQTLDSVTGEGGDGLDLFSSGGDITVSGVTAITGYGDGSFPTGHGVRAYSNGGDISIQGVGVDGRRGDGIRARSGTGGLNIGGLNAVGNIKGEWTGIDALVSSGASASNGLTINTTGGTVEGVRYGGILARNGGQGATTITTANVKGGALLDGLYAYNAASAGDMTVNTAAGTVTGAGAGVSLKRRGSNALSLTVDDVTGGDDGVYIDAATGATTITLTSTALVDGETGAGVEAQSTGGTILLKGSLDANSNPSGAITGATDGAFLRSGSSGGDITVRSLDAIDGDGGDGVDVLVRGGSGKLTISDVTTITGVGDPNTDGFQGHGVRAIAGGDVSIQAVGVGGQVEGKDGDGIYTYSTLGGVNIGGLDAIGNIKGSRDGVSALIQTNATGDLTIDASTPGGRVEGVGASGIVARHYGAGATSITTANVYGNDTTGSGILAANNGVNTTGLTINTVNGAVTGGASGITGKNFGAGAELSITTANVTGDEDGIYAYNAAAAGDLTVNTAKGTVSGGDITGDAGIEIIQKSSGATSLTVGDVKGGVGVDIEATTGATDIMLALTATGEAARVESTTGAGVDVLSTGGSILLEGSSGEIVGGGRGANLQSGGGSITVQKLDSVSARSVGLSVNSGGGAITIRDIGTIYSGTREALSAISGGGDISIQDVGLVGGVSAPVSNLGILAQAEGGNIDIGGTVAVGNVTGATAGIQATTTGAGNIIIDSSNGVVQGNSAIQVFIAGTATGSVSITTADLIGTGITGRGSEGVTVVTSGADLTIDTRKGRVQGADFGVRTAHSGSGATTILTGDVTGGEYYGISAATANNVSSLVINTSEGAVSSDKTGIRATNEGVGALSITTAAVTGGAGVGVDAYNAASAAELTIDTSAGAVTGGTTGINAINLGDGGTFVTTADVTGTYQTGVAVQNVGSGDLIIDTSAGAVEGADFGVGAGNAGDGATTIITADVTGAVDNGIDVFTSPIGTDLTIDSSAGSVTGGNNGIFAFHEGAGALSIKANNVTALAGGDDAIDAYNSANGTSLTITTTGVVASAADDGIDAVNFGGDLVITIDGGSVSGYDSAIEAYTYGSGSTTITVAGAVASETGDALFVLTETGASITIEDGGSVTGGLAAIYVDNTLAAGDPTDDTLTIESGGSVTGDVLLLAGDDVFNDASGLFTTVDGGDGLDTVNFTGGARTVTGDDIQAFEVFNISSDGLVLAGTHVGLDEANFLAGANTLTGSLEATTVDIASGATLNAADGSQVIGLLTNNGTLNVGDSPGTLSVDGDLVLGATSVLPMEVGATSDLIVVSGDVTLGGALDVMLLPGAPFGVSTRTIIDGGTSLGGAFDTIVGGNGLLISLAVDVDPVTFDVLLTTTVEGAFSVDGLSNNQAAVGDNLVSLLNDPALDPDLGAVVFAVGIIPEVGELRSTLTELTPQGLDLGLKFLTTSQSRFIDLALGQASTPGGRLPNVQLASLNAGPVAASTDDGAAAWGAMEVYGLSQDGGADHIDFDGTAFSFAAGVSGIAAGPLSFGIAGGYSNFDGEVDGALADASDASLFHIAGTASARFGFSALDARLDTVVGYATGDNKLVMNLVDPSTDTPVSQRGDAGVSSVDWLTRLTLDGRTGGDDWALKPHLQTGVTVYRQDAVNLGAAETTALAVDGLNNTRWQIGVGATLEQRVTDRLSLSARATGVQYFDDTENIFASRFAAAPAGSPAFRTTGREVDRQVQLDAALAYAHKSGFIVSVGAFGETGDLTLYGGSLKVQKRF